MLGLVHEVLEVEVEDVSSGGEDVEALLAGLVPPLAQLVPVRHRRHSVSLTLDHHALAAVDVLQSMNQTQKGTVVSSPAKRCEEKFYLQRLNEYRIRAVDSANIVL